MLVPRGVASRARREPRDLLARHSPLHSPLKSTLSPRRAAERAQRRSDRAACGPVRACTAAGRRRRTPTRTRAASERESECGGECRVKERVPVAEWSSASAKVRFSKLKSPPWPQRGGGLGSRGGGSDCIHVASVHRANPPFYVQNVVGGGGGLRTFSLSHFLATCRTVRTSR